MCAYIYIYIYRYMRAYGLYFPLIVNSMKMTATM